MKLPIKPAAVIFDMDGLLFDTETLYQEAKIAAATEAGFDLPLDLLLRTVGGDWLSNRRLLLDHLGEIFAVDAFRAAYVRHFDLMAATRLTLKPGALELLDTLDELRLPRAIATSSFPHNVEHHLVTRGLQGRFHVIVAQGDYVASKPAPDPYLKAAERLGVEPHLCLALEDSFNGIRSASSAGMVAVMVPDLLAPTEEIRALCAFVVDDLNAVRHLVRTA